MLAIVSCTKPSPQPQPNEERTVNATLVASPAPPGTVGDSAALSAQGNGQGNIASADRGSIYDVASRTPAEVVGQYATLLGQRRFADAYAMWDPGATTLTKDRFVSQFDGLKTVKPAIGKIAPAEGAAGSLYDRIQLTLSDTTSGGKNYVVTGPVTVRRVNDVPGSTNQQRRWRIVKMQLTANPGTAKALIEG